MKKILLSLRLRISVLCVLTILVFQMGWNTGESKACVECVPLSGALCVGCLTTNSGHTSCTPTQETCSCTVSGSCGGGIDPEGGGGSR